MLASCSSSPYGTVRDISYFLSVCCSTESLLRIAYFTVSPVYITTTPHHNRFTALFWDHSGEPVPEENFWTLWYKED